MREVHGDIISVDGRNSEPRFDLSHYKSSLFVEITAGSETALQATRAQAADYLIVR